MEEDIDRIIREFKSRTIYSALDAATLAAIADDKVEQAVIDYVALKIGSDFGRATQVVRALPAGICALYSTWEVEGQVNNGGFTQYFWNTRGQMAEDAVTGFMLFGVMGLARLMQEAIRIHAEEVAAMGGPRRDDSVEAFAEACEHTRLAALDDEFFRMAVELGPARVALIRARPDLFTAA